MTTSRPNQLRGGRRVASAALAALTIVAWVGLGSASYAADDELEGAEFDQLPTAPDVAAAANPASQEARPAASPAASDDDEALSAEPAASVAARDEGLPQIGGDDQLAHFSLQRGLYVSTDLGLFLTFGGTVGHSNAQPYLALRVGHDVGDYLSVQVSASAGYSAGNPASKNNDPSVVGARATVNYEMLNFGAEVVGALRPSARFAIEPKLGGGISRVTPQLTSSSDPSKKLGTLQPHLVAGVDVKYLTLLTDFTAGIALNGTYILGANVIGLGSGVVLRYTF